jgi:hypothetical protein
VAITWTFAYVQSRTAAAVRPSRALPGCMSLREVVRTDHLRAGKIPQSSIDPGRRASANPHAHQGVADSPPNTVPHAGVSRSSTSKPSGGDLKEHAAGVAGPAEDLPASYPRRHQVSDGDRVAVIVIW